MNRPERNLSASDVVVILGVSVVWHVWMDEQYAIDRLLQVVGFTMPVSLLGVSWCRRMIDDVARQSRDA